MKYKIFLCLIIFFLEGTLSFGQELIGVDMIAERAGLPRNNNAYSEYDLHIFVYYSGTNPVIKDSIKVKNQFNPTTFKLIEHKFLNDSLQVLRYSKLFELQQSDLWFICLNDSSLVADVKNWNNEETPYFFEWCYRIDAAQMKFSSPPYFTNTPSDFTFEDGIYKHTVGIVDPEGFALEFSVPEQINTNPVFTAPSATNSFTINPNTGEIIWDKPTEPGNFLIGVQIKEVSPIGNLLSTTFRMMVVNVPN